MKVIIAGSRNVNDPDLIEKTLTVPGFEIAEVIEGSAKRVDTLAKDWAEHRQPSVTEFKADCAKYSKAAGP